MSNVPNLTPQSTIELAKQKTQNSSFQPIVQIITLKNVAQQNPNPNAQTRYRVVLSDGQHFVPGMIATQNNELIYSGQLNQYSIIQIEEYMTNHIGNKVAVVLIKFRIVASGEGIGKIGNPLQEIFATGMQQIQQGGNNTGGGGMYGSRGGGAGGAGVGASVGGVGGGGGAPATVSPHKLQFGQQGQQQQQQQHSYNKPAVNTYNNNNGGYNNNNNRYNTNTTTTTTSNNSSSNAPISRNMNQSSSHYTPIANLNMYQNRWTIKARVTNKTDIRHWSNAKGDGQLFSVELLDGTQDIRATFFKEAVERFYDVLEMGKVYTFSGGRLKVANMQYNTCKSSFEITFDQNSEIHLQNDDDPSIAGANIYDDIIPIATLEQIQPNDHADLCGIITSISQPSSVTSKKTGKELQKCELTLVDDSHASVNVTLWGQDKVEAASRTYGNFPLVVFKKLRVSDFGGRTASVSGGAIVINPQNFTRGQDIIRWYNNGGTSSNTITNMSAGSIGMGGGGSGGRETPFDQRKTISTIKNEKLGYNDKPDWITVKATFSFIKKDKEGGPWYTACANPNDPCKNRCKVTPTADNVWHCERCQQTYPNCVRRFILSATIVDDTSSTWVSLFDEQVKQLLSYGIGKNPAAAAAENINNNNPAIKPETEEDITADALYKRYFEEKDNNGGMDGDEEEHMDGFNALFNRVCHTDWIVKCKVKQDLVGDESRVKTSIYSLKPVDYAAESRELLSAIAQLG